MRLVARFAILSALMAALAAGAPKLSVIEDVLFKADGSKFNGVAFIEWKGFQTADASNIATQSAVAQIVDGVLRVALAPTTNASSGAYYSVRYYSGGRIQFSEFWAVPPSAAVLKLSDVRIAGLPPAGTTLPPGEQTLIQMSDVVGLEQALEARPAKGPGYMPGRVAVINEFGALEGAPGDPADCVRVDGTAGPCGMDASQAPGFVDGETPAGAVDGTNAVFTLLQAPNPPESLKVYRNGLLQKLSVDYTLDGNVISFAPASVPQSGDILQCSYRVSGETGGSPSGGLTFSLPQVLCSGTGAGTSSTDLTSLGSCTIPAGTLRAGDRVEIRFSYHHEGTATGFNVELRWGATALLSRTAGAAEPFLAGRAEAGIHAGGAQWDVHSWGSSLAFSASAGDAADALSSSLQIGLFGRMTSATADMLALRNFTVIRYPAMAQP